VRADANLPLKGSPETLPGENTTAAPDRKIIRTFFVLQIKHLTKKHYTPNMQSSGQNRLYRRFIDVIVG